MIKVDISYKGKGLEYVVIKGHAESQALGHDLVCAAVSAVGTGAMNAIESEDDFDIELDDGYISCKAKGAISEHDQTVLETMIIQLKTIEQSTKDYITIKERKN